MPSVSALTLPNSALLTVLRDAGVDVRARASDRLAAAHDASHYQLTPGAVVRPADAAGVAAVLGASMAHQVPVTFRSGGTSLSGQAGGEGLLVDTRRSFRRVDVLDGGRRVQAQPGATLRSVNARLARHGRKLGPDPASEIACTIGGVIANNSSGMSCGTHANAYRTLESAVLVLPSGTVVDTSASDALDVLRHREPRLVAGLLRLRDRIRNDPSSVATLRRLHSLKNTMGYGLNSFLDHDDPVRILEHLVIGSEGTLAFVAEATFHTVPVHSHVATGLLVFSDLAAATAALPRLVAEDYATIELLDAGALAVAQRDARAPAALAELNVDRHAALLVEHQRSTAEDLQQHIAQAHEQFARLPLVTPSVLTPHAETRAALWHIRKGLFTAVAGARPPGTTALLEDIAVPVSRLSATCTMLQLLFERFGYVGSVIFGHAKDGNVHFLINERFDDPEGLARYQAFTEALVELVLGEGGTLKAEHGTGRAMAPFVRRQYGDELYAVMWEVKRLLDPDLLLNPGVLLTDDPLAHVTNLKSAPAVEAEVDRCVECGYCEPVCPSRDLTLTPRERIGLRRELQQARDRGDTLLARELEEDYRYAAVETCAVDGLCQTACPVLINTGDLVRRLRAEAQPPVARAVGSMAARHWGAVTSGGGIALSVAKALPSSVTTTATRVGRALLGKETVPLYSRDLPGGGERRRRMDALQAVAVYFPSCTATMFGSAGPDGVSESFRRLCARARVALVTPDGIPSLCCGTPWKSKGLTSGYELMRAKVAATLVEATRGGELPVVCDASSCTEGLTVLLDAAQTAAIRVVDAVAFVDEAVLPLLPATDRIASVTLHPTCSSQRLDLDGSLLRVASAAAEKVVVPEDWGCCGFAGDRGMLHPELAASASAGEAANVDDTDSAAYASLNRTCELGMTRATGREYRHILQVLDDALPSL